MDEFARDAVDVESVTATFGDFYDWVVELLNEEDYLLAAGASGKEDEYRGEAARILADLPRVQTQDNVWELVYRAFGGELPRDTFLNAARNIWTVWSSYQRVVNGQESGDTTHEGSRALLAVGHAQCPCCGYYSIGGWDLHHVCPICYWTDNMVQTLEPTYSGGPNSCSLMEGDATISNTEGRGLISSCRDVPPSPMMSRPATHRIL